jgi:hypothetical protein
MAKEPHDVFTPRAREVNQRMYVDRPDLEKALERGINGSLHLVLYGDSGSGKSWLYKRVLERDRTPFVIANLANASRLGSIAAELRNIVARQGQPEQTGYSEEKQAEANALVAKGGLSHTKEFAIPTMEPFEAALAMVGTRARGKRSIFVLDNLEAIYGTTDLMKELADLIILLDDDRYAQYNSRFLIVGVPRGVRDYFRATPAKQTIANRLQELPEVKRLHSRQVSALVRRGLIDELRYSATEPYMAQIAERVYWVTAGVPQYVHEYCLNLAYLAEDNHRLLTPDLLDLADGWWVGDSLAECYVTVEAVMNTRETKTGRRNQVLYSLGRLRSDDFRATEVEQILRKEFPRSTYGKGLNVNGILADLSKREPSVIRKAVRDRYVFTEPRYRMCIRAMLRKQEQETVRRIEMESFDS